MNRIKRWGSYMWTASAAGWLVIGYITDIEVASMAGVACLFMACLWMVTIDTE